MLKTRVDVSDEVGRLREWEQGELGATLKTSAKGEGRGVREQGELGATSKMSEFGEGMVLKENLDSVLPPIGMMPSFGELAEIV